MNWKPHALTKPPKYNIINLHFCKKERIISGEQAQEELYLSRRKISRILKQGIERVEVWSLLFSRCIIAKRDVGHRQGGSTILCEDLTTK